MEDGKGRLYSGDGNALTKNYQAGPSSDLSSKGIAGLPTEGVEFAVRGLAQHVSFGAPVEISTASAATVRSGAPFECGKSYAKASRDM